MKNGSTTRDRFCVLKETRTYRTTPSFHGNMEVLQQSQRESILRAGSLLQALHITENNGIGDTHQMPFSARYGIDRKEVIQALQQVNHHGIFNLEILGERNAPMPIKRAKLAFIRTMCDHILSDEFIKGTE